MIARAAIFGGTQAPRTSLCPQRPLHGFTINPDGRERAPIGAWPAGALPWSWAGDGARVVVSLDGLDLNSEIYTVAPDGTELTRLTRDLAFEYGPALSPDGSQIAFARGVPEVTDLYLVGGKSTAARAAARTRSRVGLWRYSPRSTICASGSRGG